MEFLCSLANAEQEPVFIVWFDFGLNVKIKLCINERLRDKDFLVEYLWACLFKRDKVFKFDVFSDVKFLVLVLNRGNIFSKFN